ncbi:hypothetical protein BDW59DRAFT_177483 [Aspergillus cavernicola]|uniref:F-box domain-containing protein n=1 Tax=Aspergillus cavernicola TaxID=176166 RepID=A0ABR4HL36_9EURO
MPHTVSLQIPFSRDPTQRLRQKPKVKNVQKARIKHSFSPPAPSSSSSSPSPSSLYNRIFALPTEIRLEIYRHLLVRPCKFNLFHHRRVGCDEYPFIEDWKPTFRNSPKCLQCAECRWARWRNTEYELTSDTPARSQWARPKTNPFLCDDCYPDKQIEFGHEKSPLLKWIKCLCPRRTGLGVLLTNRRVYEEAAPIFWTENTFAFETGRNLADFLEAVGTDKRALIRSISFLSPVKDRMDDEEIPRCWPLLQQCLGLRELELDAAFLDDFACVKELSSVRVGRVWFVEKPLYQTYSVAVGEGWVWPRAAYRVAYKDSLVDLLGGCMMEGGHVDEGSLRRLFEERMPRGESEDDD